MLPVFQTKFSDEIQGVHGNCMAACVASLLELSIENVPAWEDMGSDGTWVDSYYAFLDTMGYSAEGCLVNIDTESQWWNDLLEVSEGVNGCFIVGGKSPRFVNRSHAVLYRDGKMIHDPHPSGDGLISIEEVYLIEKL